MKIIPPKSKCNWDGGCRLGRGPRLRAQISIIPGLDMSVSIHIGSFYLSTAAMSFGGV